MRSCGLKLFSDTTLVESIGKGFLDVQFLYCNQKTLSLSRIKCITIYSQKPQFGFCGKKMKKLCPQCTKQAF